MKMKKKNTKHKSGKRIKKALTQAELEGVVGGALRKKKATKKKAT